MILTSNSDQFLLSTFKSTYFCLQKLRARMERLTINAACRIPNHFTLQLCVAIVDIDHIALSLRLALRKTSPAPLHSRKWICLPNHRQLVIRMPGSRTLGDVLRSLFITDSVFPKNIFFAIEKRTYRQITTQYWFLSRRSSFVHRPI